MWFCCGGFCFSRWSIPASLDPDAAHPFGFTETERNQLLNGDQSNAAFTSVTVSVTSVPAVFSVVGDAPWSFSQFSDGWARVTLLYVL